MGAVTVLGQKCLFPDVGKMVGPRVLRDAVRVLGAVTVPAGIVTVPGTLYRSLYRGYTPALLLLCYLGSSGFVTWEARPNIWGAGTVTAGTGTVTAGTGTLGGDVPDIIVGRMLLGATWSACSNL